MQFPQPLARGQLVRRYKRFFADVVLDDGREITAHCPNPGAMLGLNTPGLPAFVSTSDNPKRKLARTLELVEADGGLVGINTLWPNRLVAEALAADAIPELAGYATVRPEVKYGAASRVDFVLNAPDRPPCFVEANTVRSQVQRVGRCWIEVKGVTLHRGNGLAEWPDCVSARGARHIAELEQMVAQGDRAAVLFVVQRSDCDRFSVAANLDPAFAKALDQAHASGVEVLAYSCDVSVLGIKLTHRLDWSR
jgi:sugar fermentation stimulation protein A